MTQSYISPIVNVAISPARHEEQRKCKFISFFVGICSIFTYTFYNGHQILVDDRPTFESKQFSKAKAIDGL